MISDPNLSFKGVPHCDAVLACLHYLASGGESVDPSVVSQDVLNQLKKAAPLIAPSKRCCPVCAAIQHELSLLSGRPGNYPIYSKHVHIYGYALPPGLPCAVRERVIRKFEDLLRIYLDEVKVRSCLIVPQKALRSVRPCSIALSPLMTLRGFQTLFSSDCNKKGHADCWMTAVVSVRMV
ncbi:hypothetical protein BDD12DRAFT_19562 [Trichophaea hybrida]|nr:hypothetical protein BDD12DRAFT_19562 [Trichophaea hybrida]